MMSVAEILLEIPKLNPEEREEIRACLNEYSQGDEDCEESLTPEEHAMLEARIEDWKNHPETSIPWDVCKAELKARVKV